MMLINMQTQHIRKLLYPIVGETKAKTYFSYYGIFKDDVMFGLYKDGNFYLYLPQIYLTEIKSNYNVIQLLDKETGIHSKLFYLLPREVMENLSQYAHWFTESIKEIRFNQQQKKLYKKQKIRYLPNMNINYERVLKKLNIYSIPQLKEQGAINVFVELLKTGIQANITMLFKIYGAIHHQYIYTISEKKKMELVDEVNYALYQAGLRQRFKLTNITNDIGSLY